MDRNLRILLTAMFLAAAMTLSASAERSSEIIAGMEKKLEHYSGVIDRYERQWSRLGELEREMLNLGREIRSANGQEREDLETKQKEIRAEVENLRQEIATLRDAVLEGGTLQVVLANLRADFASGNHNKAMKDMLSISTAANAYQRNNRSYPAASSIHELQVILEPDYVTRLALNDPWDNPYRLDAAGSRYWIISHGADGSPEPGLYDPAGIPIEAAEGPAGGSGSDIIYRHSRYIHGFFRYPAE